MRRVFLAARSTTIDQTFADPQVQHLGMATKLPGPDGKSVVASAISMSGVSKAIRRATPEPDADAAEILREIGTS